MDLASILSELDRQVPHIDDPAEAAQLGRKYGWDVVAHFPLEDPHADEKHKDAIEKRNHIRRNFVWRLKKIGLVVVQQKSVDQDTCFIKICATTQVLAPHAERIGMEMKSKEVDPITGRNYYREFSLATMDTFVGAGAQGEEFKFSSLERCRLIYTMIETPIEQGGAGLDIDTLSSAVRIVPLHDESAKDQLAERWLSWSKLMKPKGRILSLLYDILIRSQPLDDVRDYFGEKIALYFAWLDWYSQCLKPLALLGLLVFLVQMGAGFEKAHPLTIIYAIVLCVWATIFSETWKRRESTLAFFWDVQDFEEEERIRPEFIGELRPGVYTEQGSWVDLQYKLDQGVAKNLVPENKYFSKFRRFTRVLGSVNVIGVFLFTLIVATFAILAFRVFLQAANRAGAVGGGVLAGIINAVFIMFMNVVYNSAAIRMNNWENHRTDTQHEDKLIVKQFSFKFVNTYASLAFIAFAKDDPIPPWLLRIPEDNWPLEFSHKRKIFGMDIGRCKGASCMEELFTQLMTVQLTMIFVSNFIEVGLPYLKKKVSLFLEKRSVAKMMSGRSRVGAETEAVMPAQDLPPFEVQTLAPVFPGVLDEYTELMIQYGYVTLFAVAFPLSSLFGLFNNLMEVRIDGFKLLFATQRPRYLGAEDIGTWQAVLEFVSILSVVSNCALICFTSTAFKGFATDRDSAWYQTCVGNCDVYRSNATLALNAFTNSSWYNVSQSTYTVNLMTNCILDCNCDSQLDTCYTRATLIWIFVVSEHFLIGFKLLLALAIPDKPAFVEEAEERAKFERELSQHHHDHNTDANASDSANDLSKLITSDDVVIPYAVRKQLETEYDAHEDKSNVWDNEGITVALGNAAGTNNVV